jgi:hypothetical protein
MGKVLLAAAAYLVVLAMLSRGPLGPVRLLGPRLHRALDLVLVIGLAVSPIFVRSNLDVAGVIVAEALAIVLLRLALRTHYVPAPAAVAAVAAASRAAAMDPGRSAPAEEIQDRARAASAEGGAEAPPAAAKQQPAGPPAGPRQTTDRRVPTTAWTLGVLAARARRRGTGSDRVLGEGARRLGTALGRASRRRSD